MYLSRILIMFVCVVLLVGCVPFLDSKADISQKNGGGEEEAQQKAIKEIEPHKNFAGTEALEIIQQGPGEFGGDNYDEAKVKKAIEAFPKDRSDEEYFHRLLALIAEDYRPYKQFFEDYDTSIMGPSKGPDSEVQLPGEQEINVLILLDASGSMAAKVPGGVKMDLAQQAIRSFVSELPEDANVALQVYGHKGSNSQKDKKISCSSAEEIHPLASYGSDFDKALGSVKPVGWTPLAAAIEKAEKQLSGQTDAQNLIYIVSDGVETCDGDPVAAAKKLNQSDIQAAVNLIGFDVNNAGQQALREIAVAGGGSFTAVQTGDELAESMEKERNRLIQQWDRWAHRNAVDLLIEGGKMRKEVGDNERAMKEKITDENERIEEWIPYISDITGSEEDTLIRLAKDRRLTMWVYAQETSLHVIGQILDNESDARDGVYERKDEVQDSLSND
ncbi:vWA domain-containing protein [Desmospora profundinema]|uniref:D-amino-acid dehydrogenase/Ca-activated chloride channel family protein n=1 Tax=Desmospora profundinema TaxID=1571184 RepID=A0ABU1IGV3_9BACL|nr:VWA domain-containing protein [Desmospora profundinema]MDR6224018.1 D-amino-acid dehydrogenase/Ca-activated chloride channel family protein [Desmospora profundinema]